MFRTDLGAALGDVAVTETVLLLSFSPTVKSIQWVHIKLSQADEKSRASKCFLVLLVISDNVASVLTEKTFDAFAELLAPLNIDLSHPVFP